jgi:hypothetical protein
MKSKLLGFIALVLLLGLLPSSANALTFDFSFTGGCAVAPFSCTVTGKIDGLTDNATSAATAVIIDTVSSSAFTVLSLPFNTICGSNCLVTSNSFTVTSGVITAENFDVGSTTFTDTPPFDSIWSLTLGALGSGVMTFSNGSTIPGTNPNVYYQENIYTGTGASFAEVPVGTTPLPAALPLFATGLGVLGLLGWRRKRKAAAIAAA